MVSQVEETLSRAKIVSGYMYKKIVLNFIRYSQKQFSVLDFVVVYDVLQVKYCC